MYTLMVLSANMMHPPLKYAVRETAFADIREAVDRGYLLRTEADGSRTYIFTGEGTIYRLMSDEALQNASNVQRQKLFSLKNGLIVPDDHEGAFRIIVMVGPSQMDPELEYPSQEAAVSAVMRSFEDGYLYHRITDDDEVFIDAGPGMTFLLVSKETADARRRAIAEQVMRQQSASPQPLFKPSKH